MCDETWNAEAATPQAASGIASPWDALEDAQLNMNRIQGRLPGGIGTSYTEGYKRYLTVEEVADRFRTSVNTVYHWRKQGHPLKGARVGRNVLFPISEIEAYEATLMAEVEDRA